MASLLNMSGGSLLNKRLPYDAEIEYLESTGTQWIDLGFYATDNIVIETEVYRGNNNVRVDFGAEENWTINVARFVIIENSDTYYQYGKKVSPSKIITSSSLVGKLSVKINKWKCIIKNFTDGKIYEKTFSTEPFTTPATFALFVANIPIGFSVSARTSGCRFYNFNVADTNVNMNLIPVRIGNVGYMYDKVSGQLFGNAGTGAFILGADKQ